MKQEPILANRLSTHSANLIGGICADVVPYSVREAQWRILRFRILPTIAKRLILVEYSRLVGIV